MLSIDQALACVHDVHAFACYPSVWIFFHNKHKLIHPFYSLWNEICGLKKVLYRSTKSYTIQNKQQTMCFLHHTDYPVQTAAENRQYKTRQTLKTTPRIMRRMRSWMEETLQLVARFCLQGTSKIVDKIQHNLGYLHFNVRCCVQQSAFRVLVDTTCKNYLQK